MLVLTRKSNQSIMIGDDVEVSVLSVMGDKAPQEVPVFRTEIYLEIHRKDGEGAAEQDVRGEVSEALRDLSDDPQPNNK